MPQMVTVRVLQDIAGRRHRTENLAHAQDTDIICYLSITAWRCLPNRHWRENIGDTYLQHNPHRAKV